MDKQFWFEIRDNKYAVPEGQSAAELTEELFSYIDSTDPELRDDIGYETFANWLEKRRYTPEQIRTYIMRLIINLQNGIGERDTDTVFSREFSVLLLAEIIHNDNKQVYLHFVDIPHLFTKTLTSMP